MIGELTLGDESVASLNDDGEWGSDTPELLHVLNQSFHPLRDAETSDHHRPYGVAALDRAAFALGLEVRLAQPVGPDPMDDEATADTTNPATTNAPPSHRASAAALYELSDEYTRAETRDVARAVLAGYANDKSPEAVSRVIQKQLGIPKAQADVVAQTELTRVAAADQLSEAGRAAEESGEGKKGKVRFISGVGSCDVCSALHGQVYSLEDAQDVIPVHPNCTCRWQVL